jgi:hypothetical protein
MPISLFYLGQCTQSNLISVPPRHCSIGINSNVKNSTWRKRMNLKHLFIFTATVSFYSFATIITFQAIGILGVVFLIFVTILVTLAIIYSPRFRTKLIDEMEVGVIFNRINNSFCRFEVSPEPTDVRQHRNQTARRWIPFGRRMLAFSDPYFVRLKWYEELVSTIPKNAQTASGKLEDIRTTEGVPVSIEWNVKYAVDVTLIDPKTIEHKMARALPEHSGKIIRGKVERVIKHLVETRTIQSLYELGAIQQLEQEVSQRVYRQLSHPVNLGFKEISPKSVSLGPIVVPAKVEKALELAHQRKIQAETVAGALERLKRAVNGFNKEDIRNWSELERLRILDDKEADLLYMSDAFVQSESMNVEQSGNGRSQHKS